MADEVNIEEALRKIQTTEQELARAQRLLNESKARETEARQKALKDAKAEDVNKELAEFAEGQSKELTILRTAMEFGLTEKDFEGVDFQSPTEIRLKAELLANQRKFDQLVQQQAAQRTALEDLTKRVAERAELADNSDAAGGDLIQGETPAEAKTKAPTLDDEYGLARKAGRTADGRMRLLNAIHRDPSRRIRANTRE